MPEGDTVFLAASRLQRALAGHELLETDFRVPRIATVDLFGRKVEEVVPRGKHILVRIEGGTTLHTHLKMEGSWHLYRPKQSWRGPDFQVRVVLVTEPWVAVGFRLGVTELIPTDREGEVVGHLGPDLLGPDWDPDEVLARMTKDPARSIGSVLLDQEVVAGFGNIYKCELCFLRGILPSAPIGTVGDLEGLLSLGKRMIEANRTTGNQITTGDLRPGRGQWVYGRGGRPCRRCRTPIRKELQPGYGGDRVTYWCPRCQSR